MNFNIIELSRKLQERVERQSLISKVLLKRSVCEVQISPIKRQPLQMKKENDSKVRNIHPSHFEEKERAIMKRKIEFLELQIAESSRRESTLKHSNDLLRASLNEANSEKGKGINTVAQNDRSKQLEVQLAELTRNHNNLKADYLEQQSKLEHISEFMNQKYQDELQRVQQLAEEQLRKMQEKSREQRLYYERKLKQYEVALQKFNRLHQCADKLDFQTNVRKRRCNDDFNQVSTSHLQSFTNLIPEANYASNFSSNRNFSTNQSYFDLPYLKHENLRVDHSPLDDLDPIPLKHVYEQPRQSINRSKSIIGLDTSYGSYKPKTIATSLLCMRCQNNYQPNEYYRHIRRCEEDAKVVTKLLQKKDSIDKQISAMKRKDENEVDGVVVLLKGKNRTSITSRPKVK